jgi:ABC-type Fe3+/spermidine/putrescine transport system ATPase subunit
MIKIDTLSVALGEFRLRDIDMTIHGGEYMVLLGPTGSGKTILLRSMVGIHTPSHGTISIDGHDVTGLDPEERLVGYVPQDYALFPNMTVRRNIEYGLRARGAKKSEIDHRVVSMMDLLRIGHLACRMPLNLSGGEKQRVALGRALVVKPRVLLLDEPLSALDENLRGELAAELRRIHGEVGGTFLHVCHDFDEACDVADRVTIMNDGRIEQVGTIEELVKSPSSLFVARFTRTRNLFNATAAPAQGGCTVRIDNGPELLVDRPARGPIVFGVRPENVIVEPVGATSGGDAPGTARGRVTSCTRRLAHRELRIDAGVSFVALQETHDVEPLAPGDEVRLRIRPDAAVLMPREAGASAPSSRAVPSIP